MSLLFFFVILNFLLLSLFQFLINSSVLGIDTPESYENRRAYPQVRELEEIDSVLELGREEYDF